MTEFPWSVVHGRRATARVAPTEGYKECLAGGRTGASAPTDMWKRLRRAGLQEVRKNGPSGTPAPTDGLLMVPYAAGHMGPALHFCRAGPVCPAAGAVQGRRGDVGSELSAASGRGSEVSEWPRSKFPASAVRQRRNFGHRNRVIRNTPAPRTRRTDCHSRCAHWLRNDMVFCKGCGANPGGQTGYWWCGGV